MTATLVIVVLLALGNMLPQTRQVLHEVTGVSPVALGIMPVVLLLITAVCNVIECGNRQKGFFGEAARLDAPQGLQLLVTAGLFGVFAAAVSGDEEDQPKQECKAKKNVKVKLLRVDRIATRLACAASFVGFLQIAGPEASMLALIAVVALCNILPASRQQMHKVTGVSPVTLGLMPLVLFLITALYFCHEALGTALVHSSPKAEATIPTLPHATALAEPSSSYQLMLLLIALMGLNNILPVSRQFLHEVTGVSPVALGLTPLVLLLTGALPNLIEGAGPQKGFAEAQLDVTPGMQLLLVAALLGVFAAAVRSSEESQPHSKDTNERKLTNLVKVDRIAWRLACAAAVIGLFQMAPTHAMMSATAGISQLLPKSPQKGFGNSDVSLDVSEGAQLLTVAALLFTFKVAIDDANEGPKPGVEEEKTSKVQLVKANTVALRLSCAAMISGCLKLAFRSVSSTGPASWSGAASTKKAMVSAFMELSEYFPKSKDFGKTEAVLEVPEGVQLLVIAALLFVFKLSIQESAKMDKNSSAEKKEKPNVKLVDGGRIAFRLAVGAGTVGVFKTLSPVLAPLGNVLVGSKELLAQGTMLVGTTGFVVWNGYKQRQDVKAC